VIRPRRRLDAGVQKIPHREHLLETLLTVEMHLLAVEEDVARKGQWYHAGGLDAPHELRRDERAVLDPQTRIAPRELALQLLVDAEDHVDGDVSVRVRANLPTREIGLARLFVQRLAR